MALLTLLHAGIEMKSVWCFELQIVKIHSVGFIDLLADTVRSCLMILR